MLHSLHTVLFAVEHKTPSPSRATLRRKEFLSFEEQFPHEWAVPFPKFHHIPDMLLRHHQKMNRRLGRNVMEGIEVAILVDLPAGNLPGYDFAKDTIAHGDSIAE